MWLTFHFLRCVFSESWRTTWGAMSQREMHQCCCRPCWPGTLAFSGRKVQHSLPVAHYSMKTCDYNDELHLIIYSCFYSEQMLCSSQWYRRIRSPRIPCIAQPSLQTFSRLQFLPIRQGEPSCKTEPSFMCPWTYYALDCIWCSPVCYNIWHCWISMSGCIWSIGR